MNASEENNAFDLFRLILAVLVVYTHASLLGGFGAEGFLQLVKQQTSAGTLAVIGFFGMSGFLVTRSFVLRGDWRPFVQARLLRIIPGLYLSLILAAFVFAPLISYLNFTSMGWHAGDALRFVGRNLLVRVNQWNVGEILKGLPYEGSLNGSLWSLFPELSCYGLILLLGLTRTFHLRRISLLLFISIIVILHVALVLEPARENIAPTLLSLSGWIPFITAFMVGSGLYCFRDEWELGAKQALLWWLVAGVLLKLGGWALLGPIVLPVAIINGAYAFQCKLPVDLSYGLYILHFPVLQLLSALGVNRHGFILYFTSGVLITALFALLSWSGVEKPALRFKRRTVPQNRGEQPVPRAIN